MIARRILIVTLAAITCGPVASAAAAPVTLDFESGVAPGTKVTNQYGAPATAAGPVFQDPFTSTVGAGCEPPTLNTTGAHSGTRALTLDGCVHGEFYATGALIAMGYTVQDVDFWLRGASTEVFVTGLRSDKSVAVQQRQFLSGGGIGFSQVFLHSFTGNDIAYVVIETGTLGNSASPTDVTPAIAQQTMVLDDFTYTPPSAPPASSFALGLTPPTRAISPGGTVTATVPVTWFNNPTPSASPITFVTHPAPGLTATVSPNPTNTNTATLTVSAALDAPIGNASVVLDGYVDQGLPSEKHAAVMMALQVQAAYSITTAFSHRAVLACTPTDIEVRVPFGGNFDGPVDITLDTASAALHVIAVDGVALGSPAKSATVSEAGVGGAATAHFTLLQDASSGSAGGTELVTERAQGGGLPAVSATLPVDVGAAKITGYEDPGSGNPVTGVSSPQLGRPGSAVRLRGGGFCADEAIEFGTTSATAKPESVAADGTTAIVHVPRGAITGPVKVRRTLGNPPADYTLGSGPALDVRGFRDRDAFSWENFADPTGLTFDDWAASFGSDAFYLKIDICAAVTLGFGHCPEQTFAPDPIALLVYRIYVNSGRNGLCYGMSTLEGRMFNGTVAPSGFPSTVKPPTPWQLTGPTAPSPALLTAVKRDHIRQHSSEYFKTISGIVLNGGSGTTYANALRSQFAGVLQGQPMVVTISDAGAGHALLVYDIEDLGAGRFKLILADPNVPFTASELTDDGTRMYRNATAITVDGPANTWTYPWLTKKVNGVDTAWSGTVTPDSIRWVPPSVSYAKKATLPGLGELLLKAIVVGSTGATLTQVTDAHGHTLLGDDGQRRTDGQGIAGATISSVTDPGDTDGPTGILPQNGTYTVSTTHTGTTATTIGAVGDSVSAAASTSPSGAARAAAGTPVSDRLVFNAATRSATFDPGAAAAVALTLGDRTRDLTATLSTRADAAATDTLRIAGPGALEVSHSGPGHPTTLAITRTGPQGAQTVTVALGTVRAGERVRVRLAAKPGDARVTLTRTLHGHSRTTHVRARVSGGRLTLRSHRITVTTNRRLNVTVGLPSLSRSIVSAGVSIVVVRGGKIVARTRIAADGSRTKPTLTWRSKVLPRGRYRVGLLATTTLLRRGVQETRSAAFAKAVRVR